MSVEFTYGTTQYIKWTTPGGVVGLTTKTISTWFYYPTAQDGWSLFNIYDGTGTDLDEYTAIYSPSPDTLKLRFDSHWSTTNGAWKTTSNVLTAGAWHHICLTYDGGATTNNPIMYINGVSKAMTRLTAPAGTYRTDTNADLYASGPFTGFAMAGNVADLRVYSSILSAAQVAALYNDGPFTPNYDTNLVFHAPLTNCTALSGSAYDGYTLTSSQKLIDRIGCAEGTPSGSPLGSNTNPT